MHNQYIKNIAEALLLMEMPSLDKESTPHDMNNQFAGIKNNIARNHSTSTHLGNNIYRSSDGNNFYHHDGKNVIEFSTIYHDENNRARQGAISKGSGSTEKMCGVFHEALKHNKEIHTDDSNTFGSKHFWLNIHKHIPSAKISHIVNNKTLPANSEYLHKHANAIWGYNGENHLLKASI